MVIALSVIYLGGWSWLAILVGPRAAFTIAIVPFVIADLIKIAIGAAILPWAQRLVGRVV
jgi:biotin transporter BioY